MPLGGEKGFINVKSLMLLQHYQVANILTSLEHLKIQNVQINGDIVHKIIIFDIVQISHVTIEQGIIVIGAQLST